MKKINKILLMLLALSLLVACSTNERNTSPEVQGESDGEKPVLYASFFPIYDFTSKIAGDKAEVHQLVPDGVSAHDYDPTTQDMVKLEEADLIVINGNGMEAWADDIEEALSGKTPVLDSGQGLETIAGHSHSHGEEEHDHEEHDHEEDHNHEGDEEEHDHQEEGHDHGPSDPHTWLSPANAKKQAENIKNSLVEIDPTNKDYYEENYEALAKEFDKLDEEYKESVSNFSSKDLIVSHEAFGYLARDYGLNQIGIEALVPQSEPTPERMAEIVDYINENNIRVIYFESGGNEKVADSISNETGVEVLELNPLGAVSEEDKANNEDYFSIMRKNLESLEEGLK